MQLIEFWTTRGVSSLLLARGKGRHRRGGRLRSFWDWVWPAGRGFLGAKVEVGLEVSAEEWTTDKEKWVQLSSHPLVAVEVFATCVTGQIRFTLPFLEEEAICQGGYGCFPKEGSVGLCPK